MNTTVPIIEDPIVLKQRNRAYDEGKTLPQVQAEDKAADALLNPNRPGDVPGILAREEKLKRELAEIEKAKAESARIVAQHTELVKILKLHQERRGTFDGVVEMVRNGLPNGLAKVQGTLTAGGIFSLDSLCVTAGAVCGARFILDSAPAWREELTLAVTLAEARLAEFRAEHKIKV